MFSVLPDLTSRDSHSLWYTSSRTLSLTSSNLEPHLNPSGENGVSPGVPGPNAPNGPRNNRTAAQAAIIERSALGRLRADELYMERRRANVGNMGSTWLKPPGINKTLFQMREERREAEEHAEAMRRDLLAQELAEAEAGAAAAAAGDDPMALEMADGPMMDGDDPMMGVEDGEEDGEGGRDLDDEIPDADEGGFGFDGTSDDDEEEESEENSDHEDEDEDGGDSLTGPPGADDSPRRQRRELANRMASIRTTEDRMREMLATRGTASHNHRGGEVPDGGDLYGGDEEIDEDQGDILEEDDLLHDGYDENGLGDGDDLDMDANLDEDIPEAESLGGYEHTDSEAELSSDEEDDGEHEVSYAIPGSARRHPQHQQFGRNPAQRISSSGPYALPPFPRQQQDYRGNRSSLGSRRSGNGGGQRSSLDISGLLSRDGSSVIGSSPRMRRGE